MKTSTSPTFKEAKIDILTKTMVKEIKDKSVVLQMPDKTIQEVPCGMVVWAAGNTLRQVTRDLMAKLPADQVNRRGLTVDEHLRMKGAEGIFAIGDCTATSYAPTAQVASQEGAYLARVLKQLARRDTLAQQLEETRRAEETEAGEKEKKVKALEGQIAKAENLRPFKYSHQGSLAYVPLPSSKACRTHLVRCDRYIGSDRAIADLPFFETGNVS